MERSILMGNQGFMLGLAEERFPIFNFAVHGATASRPV
jgi:hypothetical protein